MQEIRCPCCNRLLLRSGGTNAQIEVRCERARCLALIGISIVNQQPQISVLKFGRIKTVEYAIQRTPPSVK